MATKLYGSLHMRISYLLPLLATLVVAGCNSGSSSNASTGGGAANAGGGKRLQIAVIPKGSTHEYWKSIHAGANRAATELGVDIIFKGPMTESDLNDQISVVQDFVTKKVDGIVLAPLDQNAMTTHVVEAQKAGIPVVIIDSGVKDVKPVSYVATDNFKAGKMGGERLGKLLNGKGSVIMLRYAEGSASTTDRENGFLEGIKETPGIKVVSDNQYGGATTDSAQKASENLLSRFAPGGKPAIDGIFCCNESTTFGMLRALQDAKLAGTIKFVGFDSSDALVQALKGGQIDALVLQNPEVMGYTGVKLLVQSIRGQKVDDKVDTGATVVDAKNMNTPDVAKLLAPPKV